MEKMRYVYVIRCTVKFEDGSKADAEYIYRVYSSLRKALDCLELYKEIFTTKFVMAGYDIERDSSHFVDFREDGHYSFLNINDGVKLTTYTINREILF